MVICPACRRSVGHICFNCGKCGYCHTKEQRVVCQRKYFREWARRNRKIPEQRWRVK